MNAQIIAAILVTAVVCAVFAFVALMYQAGNHADDRAALVRGQLVAYRDGRASALEQEQEPQEPEQAPDDGEALQCWEQDEMERIEHFYAEDADEPARRPGRPS